MVRHTWEHLQYRIIAGVSRSVPRRFAYRAGIVIADHFYRCDHQGREAVISNLRQVLAWKGESFDDQRLRTCARNTFRYFAKHLIDFFVFSSITVDEIAELVQIVDGHYLMDARLKENGGLLIAAHFGNWELGGAVLAGLGYRINAVALPQANPSVDRYFQMQREKRGINIIPHGRAARDVISALRSAEIVAVLADRDYTGRMDRVAFFGKEARLPRGPAWLAYHTKAPVIPVFLVRCHDDTFCLRIFPAIRSSEYRNERDIQLGICSAMEKAIASDPEQWYMFHRVWEPEQQANGIS